MAPSSSTRVVASIEEGLLQLEEYELPLEFQTTAGKNDKQHADGGSPVAELVDRYEKLREAYLQSQIEHGFIQHVQARDLTDLPVHDDDSDFDRVNEAHDQMTQSLQEAAHRMVTAERDLQAEYELLQRRKEELRHMLHEFQQQEQGDGKDNDTMDDDDDNEWSFMSSQNDNQDDEDEAMERDLVEQEDALRQLQRRKIELESVLEGLQKRAETLEQENQQYQKEMGAEPVSTDELEQENERLQQQLDQLSTIKDGYETRRLFLEELTGIQIVDVQEEKPPPAAATKLLRIDDHNNKKKRPPVLIHVTVELLRSHRLLITLEEPTDEQHHHGIVAARFLDNTVKDGDDGLLYLPPLDDLLPAAQQLNRGILQPLNAGNQSAGFRFVVHQALARLEAYKDRKVDLDQLRKTGCTVTVHQNPNDPEDHLFQQVVCAFSWGDDTKNTSATMVEASLRLTPDCPSVPGSVYLESLSSSSVQREEEANQELEQLQDKMKGKQSEFSSPLQFITQIRQSLANGAWQRLVSNARNE